MRVSWPLSQTSTGNLLPPSACISLSVRTSPPSPSDPSLHITNQSMHLSLPEAASFCQIAPYTVPHPTKVPAPISLRMSGAACSNDSASASALVTAYCVESLVSLANKSSVRFCTTCSTDSRVCSNSACLRATTCMSFTLAQQDLARKMSSNTTQPECSSQRQGSTVSMPYTD